MAETANRGYPKFPHQDAVAHVTNSDALDMIDADIGSLMGGTANYISKSMAAGNVTLTTEEAQANVIVLTGILPTHRQLILPAGVKKTYTITNTCTGDFRVIVKGTGGSVETHIPQGAISTFVYDGTNIYRINSSRQHTYETVAVNTIARTGFRTIFVDASGGVRTITLPDPATVTNFGNLEGMDFVVKKVDSSANAVNVVDGGGNNIDGVSPWALTAEHQFVHVQADSARWRRVG